MERSLAERGITTVKVEVIPPGVLLAQWAQEHGAQVLVKGLRSGADYEYEAPMASMNRHWQTWRRCSWRERTVSAGCLRRLSVRLRP